MRSAMIYGSDTWPMKKPLELEAGCGIEKDDEVDDMINKEEQNYVGRLTVRRRLWVSFWRDDYIGWICDGEREEWRCTLDVGHADASRLEVQRKAEYTHNFYVSIWFGQHSEVIRKLLFRIVQNCYSRLAELGFLNIAENFLNCLIREF